MIVDADNLTKKTLAALLDSTFPKAFGGPEKIDDLCREAGGDFVKTSTGFGTGGATREDVQLMEGVGG